MSKKRLLVLSSGALMALLLVGLLGGTLVLAQEIDPETQGLFTEQLHDAGKSLTEVAEDARVEFMQQRYQQAVEDGNLSQVQAD